jgi:hypothetical protein
MSQGSFEHALLPCNKGFRLRSRSPSQASESSSAAKRAAEYARIDFKEHGIVNYVPAPPAAAATASRMSSSSAAESESSTEVSIPPYPPLTSRQLAKGSFHWRWPLVYKFLASSPVKQLGGQDLTADGIVGSHQVAFWVPDPKKYPSKPPYTDLNKKQGLEHADPVIRQLFEVQSAASMAKAEKKRKTDAAAGYDEAQEAAEERFEVDKVSKVRPCNSSAASRRDHAL